MMIEVYPPLDARKSIDVTYAVGSKGALKYFSAGEGVCDLGIVNQNKDYLLTISSEGFH